MSAIANGSRTTSRKRLIDDTRRVVHYGRDARKAISNAIKLTERKQVEVVGHPSNGPTLVSWKTLSAPERLESFHQALVWLQQAENKLRDTRMALERAIEHAERTVG